MASKNSYIILYITNNEVIMVNTTGKDNTKAQLRKTKDQNKEITTRKYVDLPKKEARQ